jgi:hypothetical protein
MEPRNAKAFTRLIGLPLGSSYRKTKKHPDWRLVVRKRLYLPSALQFIFFCMVFWVIVDWGTAGGFRLTYFEKNGPTLLLFYIGYPLVFSILIFKFHWNEKRLFLATLGAIFIIEAVFTRNPLVITFPAMMLGIPLAIMVYAPLTFFPLWIARKEVNSHWILMLFLGTIEMILMLLTTFGNKK